MTKIIASRLMGARVSKGIRYENHIVETEGLGSFEIEVAIPKGLDRIKDKTLRGTRVAAIVAKASAKKMKTLEADHAG